MSDYCFYSLIKVTQEPSYKRYSLCSYSVKWDFFEDFRTLWAFLPTVETEGSRMIVILRSFNFLNFPKKLLKIHSMSSRLSSVFTSHVVWNIRLTKSHVADSPKQLRYYPSHRITIDSRISVIWLVWHSKHQMDFRNSTVFKNHRKIIIQHCERASEASYVYIWVDKS